MKQKMTLYKPIYRYMAKNRNNRMTNYSSLFYNTEDALKWYENFGRNLEKMFNRKLYFKEFKLQYVNKI